MTASHCRFSVSVLILPMKTYKVGIVEDRTPSRSLTVKKQGGEYVVIMRVDGEENKYVELPQKRWASFRQAIDDIDRNLKTMLEGLENVKFRHHIGGGIYVSVTTGFKCVDVRKWLQSFDGTDIIPTKRGVAFRIDEWYDLHNVVENINKQTPALSDAQPCYYQEDHMNQEGWLLCRECHPFLAPKVDADA